MVHSPPAMATIAAHALRCVVGSHLRKERAERCAAAVHGEGRATPIV
eukprot:SAG25_NODE_5698_length_629_cov_1.452830_1_plen_46_part_10